APEQLPQHAHGQGRAGPVLRCFGNDHHVEDGSRSLFARVLHRLLDALVPGPRPLSAQLGLRELDRANHGAVATGLELAHPQIIERRLHVVLVGHEVPIWMSTHGCLQLLDAARARKSHFFYLAALARAAGFSFFCRGPNRISTSTPTTRAASATLK